MARGSTKKHSKQAGTLGSESLTHAERKALGYGTVRERLGKETVKDFDACALTLATARDAVCTPRGVVYDREAILECLVAQKATYERELRAWERERERAGEEAAATAAKRRKLDLDRFHTANHGGGGERRELDDAVGSVGGASYAGASSTQAMGMNAKRAETLDGFWRVDGGARDDLRHEIKKPEKETKCPTTLEKLRLKDLVTIKWTKDRSGEAGKYMGPVTYKTLTNSTSVIVLKPTGDAISEERYKKTIEKDGVYEGVKIRPEKDVIRLQKGGTGYAGSGTQVESKAEFALGVGAGGEARGQSRGGQSKFGLRFS